MTNNKTPSSDDEQLVLVPTIIGQSVASIDRRESASQYKKWTPTDLRQDFLELEDKDMADAYLAILDWAEQSRTIALSSAKHACFGISGSKGGRILGLYHADGPWGYFEPAKFSGDDERGRYIKLLKDSKLLDESFDPDMHVQKRLNFSTLADAKKLIGVLEEYESA